MFLKILGFVFNRDALKNLCDSDADGRTDRDSNKGLFQPLIIIGCAGREPTINACKARMINECDFQRHKFWKAKGN
jgi:hypothetical protein